MNRSERLAALLLCGVLFTGCTVNPSEKRPIPTGTSVISETVTEAVTVTEADTGISLADYQIICDTEEAYTFHAASLLRQALRKTENNTTKIYLVEENFTAPHEILMGNTGRAASATDKTYGLLDYDVTIVGEKIVLTGGSGIAVSHAVNAMLGYVDEKGVLRLPDGGLHFVNDVNAPISDEFQAVLDNYCDVNGTPLSIAHRADFSTYPENSLEAIESSIENGVSTVEIDARRTKDGKWVLFHDASVNRTTNGKGNVADMTLDEIMQLYLKQGAGGSGAKLTTIHPAKFTDVLLLTRGRIMLNLDKQVWDYRDEIFDLLIEYNCVESAVFKASGVSAEDVRNWMNTKAKETKQVPVFSLMLYSSNLSYVQSTLESFRNVTNMVELGWSGSDGDRAKVLKTCVDNGIRPMIITLSDDIDIAANWKALLDAGYSGIMTNHGTNLVQFFETYQKP